MRPLSELKLDIKDKKILAVLEMDARLPINQIAKKVGLSKATVAERIRRIEASGLVDRFLVPLNYAALGHTTFRMYVKFENAPPRFENEVAKFLYTQGSVRWFTFVQGEWDLVFRIMASSVADFQQAESLFSEKFGMYVKSRAFAIGLAQAIHRCTFLTGNEGSYLEGIRQHSKVSPRLSKLDYQILFWLYENSRMPTFEIAKKVGQSPDVVAYHIKKLEKSHIFHAYSVRFNRNKLGYIQTKVIVWLQRATPEKTAELLDFCDSHPNVSFFGEILGPWDVEIDMDFMDTNEIYKVLREFRSKFPELIREMTVLTKIREFEGNPLATFAGYEIPKTSVPKIEV